MKNIQVNKYPALNEILWDYHRNTITGADALKIYETRWRYIDVAKLFNNERKLITNLANKYGNGFFFTPLRLIINDTYQNNKTICHINGY